MKIKCGCGPKPVAVVLTILLWCLITGYVYLCYLNKYWLLIVPGLGILFLIMSLVTLSWLGVYNKVKDFFPEKVERL
jgi:hypothetical protein